jgi:hypothetical protein
MINKDNIYYNLEDNFLIPKEDFSDMMMMLKDDEEPFGITIKI